VIDEEVSGDGDAVVIAIDKDAGSADLVEKAIRDGHVLAARDEDAISTADSPIGTQDLLVAAREGP